VSTTAAVVVAWRAGARAGACLDRLATAAPGASRVLVDCESDPAALADLLRDRAGVEPVPLAENRGFAGGANAGLTRAFGGGAAHAVLLNDDVLVEPGCVDLLVAAAGSAGAASPRIDGPEGVAFAGGELELRRGFGRHVEGARDYLTGACVCLSRAAWETVGPFEESLFLYYEDVDWCLRARARGVPLTVALEARASHAGGASSGGDQGETWAYYSTRNRLWLVEQQRGAPAARREAVRTSTRARLRALRSSRRSVALAKLAGVRDWSEHRMGRGPWPA
jgi:N-acetylglucosaminyl-diphospho-decaprenol L-rhamnosyltransferase